MGSTRGCWRSRSAHCAVPTLRVSLAKRLFQRRRSRCTPCSREPQAHGLAGLRAGCVIGDPARLESVREVVPPYSLSVFAVAGWRAALRDREYLDWYRAQVSESREILYAACDRLQLPYLKSAGNFVLINVARAGSPG